MGNGTVWNTLDYSWHIISDSEGVNLKAGMPLSRLVKNILDRHNIFLEIFSG